MQRPCKQTPAASAEEILRAGLYERGELPAEAQGAAPEGHPHERPVAPGISQGAH
jgi:hypothetical protein